MTGKENELPANHMPEQSQRSERCGGLPQPTIALKPKEWYTPAQNREEWERIERESDYRRANRAETDTIDGNSSDGRTSYIEVDKTMPRHPEDRRESAWIGSGGFRSSVRAEEPADRQVPENPRQKRIAPERCMKRDRENRESCGKGAMNKEERIQRTQIPANTESETEDEWFPNMATKAPIVRTGSPSNKLRTQSTTRPGEKSQAVKLLKGWGIRFKGSAQEDPEVLLDRLEACIEDAGEPLENLLSAMPCVLNDRAFIWYKTAKPHIKTWRDFKRRFREQYVTEYDRVDVMDDLNKRTQAKGERVAPSSTV